MSTQRQRNWWGKEKSSSDRSGCESNNLLTGLKELCLYAHHCTYTRYPSHIATILTVAVHMYIIFHHHPPYPSTNPYHPKYRLYAHKHHLKITFSVIVISHIIPIIPIIILIMKHTTISYTPSMPPLRLVLVAYTGVPSSHIILPIIHPPSHDIPSPIHQSSHNRSPLQLLPMYLFAKKKNLVSIKTQIAI